MYSVEKSNVQMDHLLTFIFTQCRAVLQSPCFIYPVRLYIADDNVTAFLEGRKDFLLCSLNIEAMFVG